jgi:osmotically-inducible protein OsmY
MKTDEQLQSEVQAEINADSRIAHPGRIGIAVQNGVVTLTGHVERETCKWEAERAAWRVDGVRAVAMELEVHPEGTIPTDAGIAEAVASLLEWSAGLDATRIHARVESGWVTLEGAVTRLSDSSAAARLATQIRGVKGVSNRIRVEEAGTAMPAVEVATRHHAPWTPLDEEC